MKYFIAFLLFLPLLSAAQKKYNQEELKASREIIKAALADRSNKQICVNNVIPDKQTAIAIVEPILFKIYGKDQILGEKPYNANLVDGYWIINGSLPKGWIGGVFLIILSSTDARVIKLIHGK
jgi:hypothetical protein